MTETTSKPKWNQHAIDDDIAFRGPLNYRHFKIIGWMLFVMRLTIPLIKLGMKADPSLSDAMSVPLGIMEVFAPLSVFFLLIASFSQLLVKQDYKEQLLKNGVAALVIIVVFELLYHRYLVGTVDAFVGNRLESLAICNALFSAANATGFMAFNVFLDLFLCTCVMFFLNYEPQKVFGGDRLKWFRCLALLPVIYEFVCMWLKIQANSGDYHMSISLFPFLTAKPPMMFFVFCAMVVYQMTHEKRFCKDGRTHEEYVAYLDTNRNSFQFAKFAALLCFLAGAIDLVVVVAAVIAEANVASGAFASMTEGAQDTILEQLMGKYLNAGFGGSSDLLLFAPIMLLFNYTKTYKKTTLEIAIPVVSVVVLLVIYMEAGLVAMGMLAQIFKEQVAPEISQMLVAMEEEDEEDEETLAELLAVLQSEGLSEETVTSEGSSAQ